MNDGNERQRFALSSSSGDNQSINIGSGVSIDACLDAIGIGPLQWSVAENHASFIYLLLVAVNTNRRYIVLVAGLANASDGIEILMVSDVLTAFGEPGNCSICLNDTEKSLLAAAMFLGMLFGGVICGSLGDRWGRRRLLMFTTLLNAVCGFLFALMSSPWSLSLFRFGTGFGVGGGIPILFAMGVEAVPPSRRGMCLCIIASFFMVGQLVLTSFSLVIDSHGWRTFAIVCATFPLVTFIMAYFVPESPRFHSLHGDNAAAYAVLHKFATTNRGDSGQALDRLAAACPTSDSLLRKSKQAPSVREAARIFFSRSHALLNVTLIIVWVAMNFGWLSLPRTLSSSPLFANACTAGMASAYGCPPIFRRMRPPPPLLACAFTSIMRSYGVKDFYEKGYYSALASLPGNLFSFWGMDRFGRKPLMFVSLLLSSVVAGCMYATTSGDALVVLFCMLNAVSVVAWNALDCISTEAYPTSIRGFAFGLLAACGRLASASGQLVHIDGATSDLPLAISCVVLGIGAISSLKIPFVSGANLADE